MLIVNLLSLTHNIISLSVNCNLLLSLLAEQSLFIIFVISANSIKVLLIEQAGNTRPDIYIISTRPTVIVICKLTYVFNIR